MHFYSYPSDPYNPKHNQDILRLNEVIKSNPNYAKAYIDRGNAKAETHNYTEADQNFQEALKLATQQGHEELCTISRSHINGLHIAFGSFNALMGGLQERYPTTGIKTTDIDTLLKTAEDYLAKREYVNAVPRFNKAIELDPNNAQPYRRLAFAKRELRDYKGAEQVRQTALKLAAEQGIKWYSRDFYMRPEVIKELKTRIEQLEKDAEPMDILSGMSGSMVRFEMYLKTQSIMTRNEFDRGFYNEWLTAEHSRVFEKINNELINRPDMNFIGA